MRKHTLTALILGVVAIAALGIWWAPSFMDRDAVVREPAAAVETPPAEAPKARRAPAPRAAARPAEKMTIAPDVVPALPASEPELQARLKPVLNRGTRMELAAEGFRDAEQFAAVAHAARNTGVPFAVLEHRVLEEGKTLPRAIRESKPEVDAEREATRARNAARFDIAVVTG
jgi:hypothetical protein